MTKQFYTVLVSFILASKLINQLLESSKLALPLMFFTSKSNYILANRRYLLFIPNKFFYNYFDNFKNEFGNDKQKK